MRHGGGGGFHGGGSGFHMGGGGGGGGGGFHHANIGGGFHGGGGMGFGGPHMGYGGGRVMGPVLHPGFRAPLYRPLLLRPYRTAFRPYMGIWPRWGPAWYAGVWYGGLYGPYGPGCPLYGYSPSGYYYGDACDPAMIAAAPGSGVVVVNSGAVQQPVTVMQSSPVAPGAVVTTGADASAASDDPCDCCDACCYGCDCECLWCCCPRSASHRGWSRRRHVSFCVTLVLVVWIVFWCVFAFGVAGSQRTRADFVLEEGQQRLFPLATSDPLWATNLQLTDRSGSEGVVWFMTDSASSPVIVPPSTSSADGAAKEVSQQFTGARAARTGHHNAAAAVTTTTVFRGAQHAPSAVANAVAPMVTPQSATAVISVNYPYSNLPYTAYASYDFYLASSSTVSATVTFSGAVDVIIIVGDDAYAYWADTGDRSVAYAVYERVTNWTGAFTALTTDSVYWAVESNYVRSAISGSFGFDIRFAAYDTSAMTSPCTGTCTVTGSTGRRVTWLVAKAPAGPFNGGDLYGIAISRELTTPYRGGEAVAILFGVAVGVVLLALTYARCCEVNVDARAHASASAQPHAPDDPLEPQRPPTPPATAQSKPFVGAGGAAGAVVQSASAQLQPQPQPQPQSAPPNATLTPVQPLSNALYGPPVVIAVQPVPASEQREGVPDAAAAPGAGALPGAIDVSAQQQRPSAAAGAGAVPVSVVPVMPVTVVQATSAAPAAPVSAPVQVVEAPPAY